MPPPPGEDPIPCPLLLLLFILVLPKITKQALHWAGSLCPQTSCLQSPRCQQHNL